MKPVIRTLTGFISTKDFSRFDSLLQSLLLLKREYENADYEVQTIRITTDMVEQSNSFDLSAYEDFLDKLENNQDVSIYHMGSASKALGSKQENELVDFLLNHKKAFWTIDAGGKNESKALCLSGAKICKLIADKKPFECRRFAVYAGVTEPTPFYPASKVFSSSMKFSIGCQCANLAVEEATSSNNDLFVFERKLKTRLEKEFKAIEKIIPTELQNQFLGFDTSLAPFPSSEMSIANAIEILLGKPFGSSGTLSVCRVLTKIMQENNIRKTGLCGLMLPVVEDNILAKRGIERNYTLKELLLFSSVCATGLDTVPISGKTSTEDLANCYYDLVTLAKKLKKPLSARLFIEPSKSPGETIKYDWKFACESPVFKV